jgi:hypothetical protein
LIGAGVQFVNPLLALKGADGFGYKIVDTGYFGVMRVAFSQALVASGLGVAGGLAGLAASLKASLMAWGVVFILGGLGLCQVV